jgi:NADH-quinone oxidoreductase subunit L
MEIQLLQFAGPVPGSVRFEVPILHLILLFPLLGAFFNGILLPILQKLADFFFEAKLSKAWTTVSAILAVLFPFMIVLFLFLNRDFGMLKLAHEYEGQRILFTEKWWEWITAGDLKLNVAFLVDNLSMLFLLIITGIGTLIHIYSAAYMADEPAYSRFFTYLNLFIFSMLVLIMGDSLPMMFIGWEGVGLCSYLLIGFWYGDMANAVAGKKAFVANRVGDFGVLLGMFYLFWYSRDVSWLGLEAFPWGAPHADKLTIACLLLFLGATGKSAQIPLYVWLPDAMAGPTPVSALIHAATMVTAGIYMLCRLNFLFALSGTAMGVVAVIGACTALFAATIGVFQYDIKKVLAYSTVSQLGFMFVAVGVGAFWVGIFHVMTHAFFKATLFLGSGSVIHGMHHEQDMRKMGGLKKYMPVTYWTYAIACYAIAGFPLGAGFFSKDEILWKAFSTELAGVPGKAIWAMCTLAAGFTAFYMYRSLYMTFSGESRADEHTKEHIHESPPAMTGVLVVLAFLSIFGGWLGWPHLWHDWAPIPNFLEHWLHPVFARTETTLLKWGEYSHGVEYGLMAFSVLVALTGWAIARALYKDNASTVPAKLASDFPAIQRGGYNKWYVDEIYEAVILNPIVKLSIGLWKYLDSLVIDGFVNMTAWTTRNFGELVRRYQNGNVQRYALTMAVGAMILLLTVVLKLPS